MIVYSVEEFAVENNRENFAYVESKFTTLNKEIIWVLNMINTATKDLSLVVTKSGILKTLKLLFTWYIPPGNYIITDSRRNYL